MEQNYYVLENHELSLPCGWKWAITVWASYTSLKSSIFISGDTSLQKYGVELCQKTNGNCVRICLQFVSLFFYKNWESGLKVFDIVSKYRVLPVCLFITAWKKASLNSQNHKQTPILPDLRFLGCNKYTDTIHHRIYHES